MAGSWYPVGGSPAATNGGDAVILIDQATGLPLLFGSAQTGLNAQQVQGNVAHDAASAGNPVGIGGVYRSTPPTVGDGDRVDALMTAGGATIVGAGSYVPARGAANLVHGLFRSNQGLAPLGVAPALFNGTGIDPQTKPNLTSRLVSAAASTNATLVKNGSGDMFRVTGFNANAAARYLKFYNKASAPTVGTDVPVWTEYLAPQAKFSIDFPPGMYFSTGIAYALTTGSADSDTGALTAADVLAMNIAYA